MDYKKILIQVIPILIIGYIANKLAQAYTLAPGLNALDKLSVFSFGLHMAFRSPLPSLNKYDLWFGVLVALLLKAYLYYKAKNAKQYRRGIEYGSARWGHEKDIAPYKDKDFKNNLILSQTEHLTMSSRPKNPAYARNKNVLVVGGSGSGKTRFFLKPNLLQMHSSYIVTDPKGQILVECGKLLQRNKYRIKVFNTIDFKRSMHYNPFAYLRSDKDILKLVNTLMLNTKGDGDKSGEDFWAKAERLLFTALIAYIHYEAPEEERNFSTLLDMIDSMEIREDDETFRNAVDYLFEALAKREPEHFAVRQYAKYKLAAGAVCCSRRIHHASTKYSSYALPIAA